jgi:hypothetical protein
LLFWKVDVFDEGDVVNDSSQQHSHALGIDHPVDLPRPDHYSADVRVLLGSDGERGSHAGIAESLRVGQVAAAVSIDEEGLPAQGRHALAAGLAVLALAAQQLEVVAELIVLEQVLAAFAGLVVGVRAGS